MNYDNPLIWNILIKLFVKNYTGKNVFLNSENMKFTIPLGTHYGTGKYQAIITNALGEQNRIGFMVK